MIIIQWFWIYPLCWTWKIFTLFSQWNALEVRVIGDQSDSCNIFNTISIRFWEIRLYVSTQLLLYTHIYECFNKTHLIPAWKYSFRLLFLTSLWFRMKYLSIFFVNLTFSLGIAPKISAQKSGSNKNMPYQSVERWFLLKETLGILLSIEIQANKSANQRNSFKVSNNEKTLGVSSAFNSERWNLNHKKSAFRRRRKRRRNRYHGAVETVFGKNIVVSWIFMSFVH